MPKKCRFKIANKVTVAGGPPPKHRAFAGMEKLSNGELIVTYREGTIHTWDIPDGTARLVRSKDSGQTWSEPQTIYSEKNIDYRGGMGITQISDGTIIFPIPVWDGEKAEDTQHHNKTYILRSTNNGKTFQLLTNPTSSSSTPTSFPIQSAIRNPQSTITTSSPSAPNSHPSPIPYPLSPISIAPLSASNAAYGDIIEQKDGTLLLPLFGRNNWDDFWTTVLIKSYDKGLTWSEDYIILAQNKKKKLRFNEVSIVKLPDNTLCTIIREETPPPVLYISYSKDEGESWSQPKKTSIPGQGPSLILTEKGTLLCAFRDCRPKSHGIAYCYSLDEGKTWSEPEQFYKSPTISNDCSYPVMENIASNTIFCVYYTTFVGSALIEPKIIRWDWNCDIEGIYFEEK